MLSPGDNVVAGFSGGADSTALLNVLWDLKDILEVNIFALHLNHGIRQEAGEDERFCHSFCNSKGIPFTAVSVDVPSLAKQQKLTEEEAGRLARYRAFEDYLEKAGGGCIAVAHHQDDVAETLVMNLARGSGLRGGSSIRPKRDNIIRPLLCVSRSEIENYLREKEISFCTDRTNLENDHTRNYIRNVILPDLSRNVNSRAAQHMARAAVSFEKAEDFVRGYAKELFDRVVVKKDGVVSFDCLKICGEADIIQEYLVLMCFEELVRSRKDISSVHVDMVLGLMRSTDGTASADLPYGLKAVRSYNNLSIGKRENSKQELPEIAFDISNGSETETDIPGLGRARIALFSYEKEEEPPSETYTKWFDYDRIQATCFRTRRPGDHIFIDQGGKLCKKELRKFFTDVKVPEELRDEMYLLADGDHILWVPGYRMSAAVKVSKDTNSILAIKITNGGNANG